jgi:hypothetical protein
MIPSSELGLGLVLVLRLGVMIGLGIAMFSVQQGGGLSHSEPTCVLTTNTIILFPLSTTFTI